MSGQVLDFVQARARRAQEKARLLVRLSSPALTESEAREILRLLAPVREAERRRDGS